MNRPRSSSVSLCRGAALAAVFAALPAAAGETAPKPPAVPAPASSAFDRLKGLAGDWIDAGGAFGMRGMWRSPTV